MSTLQPFPGFDWSRVRWTGPYALVEWERCSYCDGAIAEDDVPLRMWNDDGWAAVFCEQCMETWWGMQAVDDNEPIELENETEQEHLGPCCVCETTTGVRNVLMLPQKCVVAGHGWGCVVCGLPTDGAVAVVCDACLGRPLRFACRGYPAEDGRILIDELSGSHQHDVGRHQDETVELALCLTPASRERKIA